VLFGSHVKGQPHEWSDIDLLVISSCFDRKRTWGDIRQLWRVAADIDSRIEPFPCGEIQWREDDSSAIVEIARREGEMVSRSG
jgi:predicted nucleotidyltransferase